MRYQSVYPSDEKSIFCRSLCTWCKPLLSPKNWWDTKAKKCRWMHMPALPMKMSLKQWWTGNINNEVSKQATNLATNGLKRKKPHKSAALQWSRRDIACFQSAKFNRISQNITAKGTFCYFHHGISTPFKAGHLTDLFTNCLWIPEPLPFSLSAYCHSLRLSGKRFERIR